MRTVIGRAMAGMCAVALAGGCGDDGEPLGSGGGGGGPTGAAVGSTATTGATSTATTATVTTGASSSSGGGGHGGDGSGGEGGEGGEGGATSGGGGGGAAPACTTITLDDGGAVYGDGFRVGSTFTPTLGDDEAPDLLVLRFPSEVGDLSLDDAVNDNLATCEACVLVLEDGDGTIAGASRIYFQADGLLSVVDGESGDANRATISGVTLVEVTVDEDEVSTPVPGGACLTIEVATLEAEPAAEWTCELQYYDNQDGCDCACGIPDPDCDIAGAVVYNCGPPLPVGPNAPTCSPSGTCVAPEAWACDEATYLDGETCDCGCGAADPDCSAGHPVVGCDAGESCFNGACVAAPDGWTCPPIFYDASDGCDCACGIYDPDCDEPGPVLGCAPGQSCTLEGECGIPSSWSCAPELFADGATCDCACDGVDPDCDGVLPVVGCAPDEACLEGVCGQPAGNDACADAVPLSEGTVVGNWLGSTNDLSPTPPSCTGFSEIGGDVFYSVSLEAGETLTVAIDQVGSGADSALYLVTDCEDAGSCVEGVDTAPNTPEVLTYTASAAIDLFLVVDQYGLTRPVDFTLTVDVQ